MVIVLVVLGAAVGAPLRYLIDRAVQSRIDSPFPWGTLSVNVLGSGLLGFLIAVPAGTRLAALASTGFCGALTTYSTFGYETVRLAEDGDRTHAVFNAVASVTAGLGAAYCGTAVARAVLGG